MTGRELILYILENGLENEEVFRDNKLMGFISAEELAAKMEVGPATVRTWIRLHNVEVLRAADTIYIPITYVKNKKERKDNGN